MITMKTYIAVIIAAMLVTSLGIAFADDIDVNAEIENLAPSLDHIEGRAINRIGILKVIASDPNGHDDIKSVVVTANISGIDTIKSMTMIKIRPLNETAALFIRAFRIPKGLEGTTITVTITVTDFGNLTDNETFVINPPQEIDNPPVVAVQSPTNTTFNTSLIPLDYTVTDDKGVVSCSFTLNSVMTPLPDCQNTTLNLTDGFYELHVTATDTIAQIGMSPVIAFTVATQQPVELCRNGLPEDQLFDSSLVCMDAGLKANGLSTFVTKLDGDQARHRSLADGGQDDGVCDPAGFYSVRRDDSLTLTTPELPRDGEYTLSLVYRVGTPTQDDEDLEVKCGSKTFKFKDKELVNSNEFETLEGLVCSFKAGTNNVIITGTDSDSVHLDAFKLKEVC